MKNRKQRREEAREKGTRMARGVQDIIKQNTGFDVRLEIVEKDELV